MSMAVSPVTVSPSASPVMVDYDLGKRLKAAVCDGKQMTVELFLQDVTHIWGKDLAWALHYAIDKSEEMATLFLKEEIASRMPSTELGIALGSLAKKGFVKAIQQLVHLSCASKISAAHWGDAVANANNDETVLKALKG